MDTTAAMTIAKILGPFLFILCVSALTHMKYFREVVKEFGKNKGELMIISVIRTLMWLMILTFYHSWGMDIYTLITIVGWLALLSWIFGLLLPEQTHKMLPVWNKHPNRVRSALVIGGLLGILLSYVWFFM